jgi:hypothetical protein
MPEYIPTLTPANLPDEFSTGYFEATEWLLNEDDRKAATRWAAESANQILDDCAAFQRENVENLAKYYTRIPGADPASAGRDFYLTRNRHGVGFWDRGNDAFLKELTRSAHLYGETEEYVGDDNLIYTN